MTTVTRFDVRRPMLALASILRDALTPVGAGADITAEVTDGVVTSLTLSSGGSGYGKFVRVVVEGGVKPAEIFAAVESGTITGLTLLSGGSGYEPNPVVKVEPYMREVYDTVPNIFSDTGPFIFMEYKSGDNIADGLCSFRREYTVNVVACQDLLQNVSDADLRTREFIGIFYDLMSTSVTLSDTVREVVVQSDAVTRVPVKQSASGGSVYLANVFEVFIIDGDES